MQRLPQTPRSDWRRRLDAQGFRFHSINPEGEDVQASEPRFAYWREDVAYRFSAAQIDQLDDTTTELHAMCLALVGEVIRAGDLGRLDIAGDAQALVEASWVRQDPHLYGRFDLAWDGSGAPKLLEYNADTPTSLIETAVAQWHWKEDVHPGTDQFNSVHEALVARLTAIRGQRPDARLHLACLYDSLEDVGNTEYLLDVAVQAGWHAAMLDLSDIGLGDDGWYVDAQGAPIATCFKLYPWEWMVAEPLGAHLLTSPTRWLEPPWKQVLANKALLPLLWEAHPGHPNLLPAYFSPEPLAGQPHVKKPLLAREGANIDLVQDGAVTQATGGDYGAQRHIWQALAPLASYPAPEASFMHGPRERIHTVLGTWVVGDAACGLCLREDLTPITSNSAYFVPHWFD